MKIYIKFNLNTIILIFKVQKFECSTPEKEILQYFLVDILNLKHGLEDILLLIQQIRQVEPQEGEDIKEVVLDTVRHQITYINTAYKLGQDWFNFDPGLGFKFTLPSRAQNQGILVPPTEADGLAEFEDIKVAVEDMEILPDFLLEPTPSNNTDVKPEKERKIKGTIIIQDSPPMVVLTQSLSTT